MTDALPDEPDTTSEIDWFIFIVGTALLAAGNDLGAAAQDALEYLDHSLGSGFRPGMGQLIPDRMFWAQPDEAAEAAESDEDSAQPPTDAPPADDEPPPLEGFEMHPHDTKH